MASEPSWGPWKIIDPLKWTEISPTNDPWMISDEFETFGDNHFWRGQTKTKIFVQKFIHFIKIQNIHSKQIFIFQKSRIFIQYKNSFFLNPEYSFKRTIHFLKEAVSARTRCEQRFSKQIGEEVLEVNRGLVAERGHQQVTWHGGATPHWLDLKLFESNLQHLTTQHPSWNTQRSTRIGSLPLWIKLAHHSSLSGSHLTTQGCLKLELGRCKEVKENKCVTGN